VQSWTWQRSSTRSSSPRGCCCIRGVYWSGTT